MIQLPTTDARREVYDYLHDHEIKFESIYSGTLPSVPEPWPNTRGLSGAEEFYSRVLSLPIFQVNGRRSKTGLQQVAEALSS